MSTIEREAIPTHVTRVVEASRVSAHFQRVTFGGLERFVPIGPDQFVYVLLPPPGRDELTIDETFRWTTYDTMPVAERPVGAYYTVRAFRPDVGEVDCDFFLHEPTGVASAWAMDASAGQPAALWGPRTAWHPPPDTDWWLLVADETGLPATAAILESLPRDAAGCVMLAVGADVDEVGIDAPPGVEVTWLHRPTKDGAGESTLLLDAVRQVSLPPNVRPYAWGGAEDRAVSQIRKHLRTERHLDRAQVSLTRYWRHPSHAADPIGDD